MRFSHLDLFSGIGGFSLAFEAAGFETVGFSETDEYASAVLSRHWPNVRNYGDIRTIPTDTIHGRIAVITGGFPCQPFSTAGKRRGKEDDRHLWPAMLQVIRDIRPPWVCGENVSGIISMELENILTDLEAIGYQCAPFHVPAGGVGAQHERSRVFVLAHSDSFRRDATKIHVGIAKESRDSKSIPRTRTQQKQLVTLPPVGESFESVLASTPCREPYGVSSGVDRIRCLGNSIVPQVASVFAKAIYADLMK